ncbi:hypothetical protein N7495_002853 [Penicillium taxi]|uniref:uncharacterized protein n=1 Tax=Penicillium taxi TaxID=168475 RepID=UPI0025458AAC|nr:uncharacterized protein N7495_002853 [Penicillium taxi]KAJ5902325.1 hypothetical protein N7495_002853 [Penicillium taxi]
MEYYGPPHARLSGSPLKQLKILWRKHFPKVLPPFLSVTDELLDRISKHLNPLDKASLALTCANFYISFELTQVRGVDSILRTPELQYPPVCLRREHPFIHNELELHPRTKLVRSLENARWRYCPDCSKLHPRSGWNEPIFKPLLKKLWPGKYPFPIERLNYRFKSTDHLGFRQPKPLSFAQTRCMPSAGVVDVCPCLAITFRQRLLLSNMIINQRWKIPRGKEHIFETERYPDRFTKWPKMSITHYCEEIVKMHTEASIETSFIIMQGCLIVENHYRFNFYRKLLIARPDLKPPEQGASNAQIVSWVRRFKSFLDSNGHPALGDKFTVDIQAAKGLSCPNKPLQKFEAKIYINLGQGDEPDEHWLRHRRTV